jgi:hypothetical protein
MRFSLAVTIAATLASLFLSGPSVAEPANPPTPTTRILAIGNAPGSALRGLPCANPACPAKNCVRTCIGQGGGGNERALGSEVNA